MNHNYSAVYENVKLRPLQHEDIEQLRQWRNDGKATRFLRKIDYITPEAQEKWFQMYLLNSSELCFAIEETSELRRLVGSVSLYNIEEDVAEIGKIQIGDKDAHGRGIGRLSLVMAMLIGFRRLGLKKIISAVHKENTAAHKNDMIVGFKIVGEHPAPMGGMEDELEMDEETLRVSNDFIGDIVVS